MDQYGQVNVGVAFFHFRVRAVLFCHSVAPLAAVRGMN
jgi:hypothetical protein